MRIQIGKIRPYYELAKSKLGFFNDIDYADIKARFIISTGRTGTKFLASFFNQLSPSILAYHEPYPSFRKLGIDYASRKVPHRKALSNFKYGRMAILNRLIKSNKHIYVEANCNLFSLVPIIREVFPDYRIIHIVRDGRDYVRSAMSRLLFREDDNLKRLKASDFPSDPYYNRWGGMSRFEKICWHWVKMDEIIYESIQNDSKCLTLKFEDIFDSNTQYSEIKKLIDFFDMDIKADSEYISALMTKKINKTANYQMPHWKNWDTKKKKQFLDIAGTHMKIYGYNIEDM